MTRILVDTSLWIAFFRGEESGKPLLPLLDMNTVCVNDLILSELIPSLKHRKENKIIDLLESIEKLKIQIVWFHIIEMQFLNLKSGINNVGISDLIIAQNALQHEAPILSLDKHFKLMKETLGIRIYE